MNWLQILNQGESLAILCAVGLPVVTGGVVALVALWMRHRERMGMIEQGIHPDYPPEDEQQDEPPA